MLQQDYATYTYRNNGTLASVTDANGNRAEMRYDGHDRQNRWVFPSKTTPGAVNESDYESYGYDANGNRTSFRKRDGGTLTYTFDNLNRMILKTVPTATSGASGYSVYSRYDLRNLPLYSRFGSTSGPGVSYVYDGFGRMETSTTTMGGVSRTLTSQYDAGSRRTRLTFPDNIYFSYAFDAAGRMTAICQQTATCSVGSSVASYSYDSLGRPDTATVSGATTDYDFDDLSRLDLLSHNLVGTSADQSLTFGYNPASQITTRTAGNAAYASTTLSDGSQSYSVNGLNQYTSVDGSTHNYDLNGNLSSDGTTSYSFDTENRLVTAGTVTLEYDPLGRLFETDGATTTQFLYDGDRLLAEYNGSGTLQRRYVHGAGVDTPVLWYEGSGLTTRRGLMADHQGSIIAMVNASGSSFAINGYDSWGVPNPGNVGRFQYTGQAWIPEIGLYHYKARIYSPELGRFLQTDPIGYSDNMNMYAYVGNDPGNARDPSGKSTLCNGPCNGFRPIAPKSDDEVVAAAKTVGEIAAGFTPAGIAIDVKDLTAAIGEGDVVGGTLAAIGFVPGIGDGVKAVGKALRGTPTNAPISMDEAVQHGSDFVDGGGDMITTGSGNNFQFINSSADEAGNVTTNIARFDVNPVDPHVMKTQPHMNMETHVNGRQTANDHIPIDPETIRSGDHP